MTADATAYEVASRDQRHPVRAQSGWGPGRQHRAPLVDLLLGVDRDLHPRRDLSFPRHAAGAATRRSRDRKRARRGHPGPAGAQPRKGCHRSRPREHRRSIRAPVRRFFRGALDLLAQRSRHG